MNDLSSSGDGGRQRLAPPIPAAVLCILVLLLLAGLAVALFILVVVRNALFLVSLLLLSALVLAFLLWNAVAHRRNRAALLFLDRFPGSDLRDAVDGQLVKITGIASCGDISLESSYEKVGGCVYTSTLLYECSGWINKCLNANYRSLGWNLIYMEKMVTDFFITDIKSGSRILVKAGNNSKVIPLVEENVLINTSKNREISTTLKKWLHRRKISTDAYLLRLEEGYLKDGNCLTVMGMLSRKNGVLTIVSPPETISTGWQVKNFLLPVEFEGLLLRAHHNVSSNGHHFSGS